MNELINNFITVINETGREFCHFAGSMFIQSSVLIILFLIIDFLIRKRMRATFRYWMWMLVFIKLVLPPTLSSPMGIGNWFGNYFSADSIVTEGPANPIRYEPVAAGAIQEFTEPVASVVSNPPVTTEAPAIFAAPALNALTWQGIVFLFWFVGVLVISVLLIQRIFFVKGLIAQRKPAKNRLVDILDNCREQVGVRRKIRLKLSPNVTSPAVCGLFRPVILIPRTLLEQLSREKLRAVLIHELAHIKRGDLWINCVQTFLQIAYFYNPFVWLANLIVRRIREQAVDEMVLVALGAEAKSYSNTLIDIAEMAFSRPALSLRLVGVVESKKALSQRIKHILYRPFPKSAKLGFIGLLAVIITAAILLPMAESKENQGVFRGIDKKINVSDETGELTINSLFMESPDGKKLLGSNSVTLSVGVANNSQKEIYLGLEYYTHSGTIAKVFSPGASSLAHIRGIAPNWQGQIEFPIRYNRFVNGGYIKITLAKCSGNQLKEAALAFLPKGVEIIHEKKYSILTADQKKAIPELLHTLRTAKERQKYKAAEKLAEFGEEVVPAIIEVLQEDNQWAAHALGEIGPEAEEAIPALIKTLTHGGVGVRAFSASALLRIGPAARVAIPALVDTLNDEYGNTRMHAADALGYLSQGDQVVIEALTNALEDSDETVRKVAAASLKRISNKVESNVSDTQNITAILHNGVTVELVGFGKKPWEDEQQWWRPDGTEMEKPDFKTNHPLIEWPDKPNGLQFLCAALFKFSNHEAGDISVPEVTFSDIFLNSGFPSGINDDKSMVAYIVSAPNYGVIPNATKISLAIGTGSFKQALSSSNGSITKQHEVYTLDDGSVVIRHPLRLDSNIGTPTVDLTCPKKDVEYRLTANLKNGQTERWYGGSVGKEVQFFHATPRRKNIEIEDIESLVIEYRSYEWIHFNNVSLRRGVKTNVKVEAQGSDIPAERDGTQAKTVLLPDVDDKPLMLDLASGELIAAPKADTPEEIKLAIEKLGKGDLFFDFPSLTFVRGVTTQSPTETITGQFKAYKIEQKLPVTLTVTTKEGINYAIKVRSIDDNDCRLEYYSLGRADVPVGMVGTWFFDNPIGDEEQMAIFPDGRVVVLYSNGHKDQTRYENGIIELAEYDNARFKIAILENGTLVQYLDTETSGLAKRWQRIDPQPHTELIRSLTGQDNSQTDVQIKEEEPKSPGGKVEFGVVDFEGYFEGSTTGGQALEQLWNDRDKDLRDTNEILEIVRKGLRCYRGSGNILRWIGNSFIWGKNPQNPKAIELMYHASGSPDRGLNGDAIYFGLSVTNNKTPEILQAMVAVAMKTDDYYNVTGRILWGSRNQKDELIAHLEPYLNSDDSSIRQKAQDVKDYFTDSDAFMEKRAQEHEEFVLKEYGDDLEQFKDRLLNGNSQARLDTLKQLNNKGIMSIVDESFLDAFEACTKDTDLQVRATSARTIGNKFVWSSDPQNQQAIEILTRLLDDPDRSTRYAAVYYGLSTIRNPDKELISKMLATIIDDREINYYGRVIWGIRRNKQACIEILKEWMNQSEQNNQRSIKAYEIYEDVTAELLPEEYAQRFAGKKSNAHEGVVAMCFQNNPLSKEELQKQFIDCLTSGNVIQKVSDFYILESRETSAGMFICTNLSDRNAIRETLMKDGLFQVAGYMHGSIGPTGSGWIDSLNKFRKSNKHNRIALPASDVQEDI